MEACSRPEISIVVPTYNEADVIERFLDEVRSSLERHGINCFEVVVVDDDSPDGTWRIVEEESKRDPRVRLIRRRGEKGLATAVIEGIKASRSDIVVVMDADLQHPPDVVPRLLEKAREGYDVVVASRYINGGGVEGWSRFRLFLSKTSGVVAKLVVREVRRTSDPMSGFFLVRKNRIDIASLRPRGYKILMEILARNPSARVADVPYIFRRRAAGSSKLGFNTMLDFIIHLLMLSRVSRFAIVGLTGSIVNLAVMYLALAPLGVDLASLLGIEAGILWNFMLHEAWTFKSRYSRGVVKRLLGYHASSLGGIVTTYIVMRLLHTLLGLHPITAQALGIIAGFIVNYMLSSGVVWRGYRDSRL